MEHGTHQSKSQNSCKISWTDKSVNNRKDTNFKTFKTLFLFKKISKVWRSKIFYLYFVNVNSLTSWLLSFCSMERALRKILKEKYLNLVQKRANSYAVAPLRPRRIQLTNFWTMYSRSKTTTTTKNTHPC